MRPIALFAIALSSLSACAGASPPMYVPASTTGVVLEGRPAISFPIAAEGGGSVGELRLASLGVARATPPSEAPRAELRALYLRMVVVNDSERVWTIDLAGQRIELERRGEWLAIDTTTPSGARPPVVRIAPQRTETFDLVFELPPGRTFPSKFELAWTLSDGSRLVDGRALFRARAEPAAPSVTPPVYEPRPAPYQLPRRYTLPR